MNSLEVYARPGDTVYSFSDDSNVVREWVVLKIIVYPEEVIYYVRDKELNFLSYIEEEFRKHFYYSRAQAVLAAEVSNS